MATPFVEIRDLEVRFGAARVLDGVSLRVFPGEVLALVGESGSGKTTLIRAIQGLQALDAGVVEVSGEAATGRHRDDIQMVFQDPTGALNPRRTVYEAVAEGLRVVGRHPDEAARVDEALTMSGLRPPSRFTALYPHELSGGQRQRVVIAGAMITTPRLLLADEPVASLDASIRGEILALLRHLVDRTGLAVLCVTHDLGLAWNIADRVAVMYLGRIVEVGPTEQLLAHPQHPYTRALLSVIAEATGGDRQILTGEIPDPKRIPAGCRFHPRCPLLKSGTVEHLAPRCRQEDPAIIAAGAVRAAACHAVDP
ncbi:MAG: ABC transporter ATP-binding protein [Actinomycetota bacterium]|nr:ABC transporter ATP-binding protein [Actinomycetota bacterium]